MKVNAFQRTALNPLIGADEVWSNDRSMSVRTSVSLPVHILQGRLIMGQSGRYDLTKAASLASLREPGAESEKRL